MKKLSPFTQFLIKIVVVFGIWYCIYDLWLLPDGRLDNLVSRSIVGQVAAILSAFGYDAYTAGRVVGIGFYQPVIIIDGCNGISPIGLFLGFILAFPGQWLRKVAFIITGICSLYIINVIRIIALLLIKIYIPEWFDIMHEFTTTFIFYLVIFGLWVVWLNVGVNKDDLLSQIGKRQTTKS